MASDAGVWVKLDEASVSNNPGTGSNLLYNGAMQVAQRGTSVATTTASGYLTADRWTTENNSAGTWTQTVENDAPLGSGLRKSLKMLCTTSKSPAAPDMLNILQWLEGQDVQRIAKGTASARHLTLSFWVKSNVTGAYTILLYDSTNNRSVGASYTVSASATWERKTITFPADTVGQIQNDNGIGLGVIFGLAAGSDFTSGTLQSTWGTFVAANRAVGQTNLAAATNNYWQVTGVQLEVGDTATEFEHKKFGTELLECQRYYYKHVEGELQAVGMMAYPSASVFQGLVNFPVTMRAVPSMVASSGTDYYRVIRGPNTTSNDVSWLNAERVQTNCAIIYNTDEASGTAGYAGWMITINANSNIAFNSEL